MVKRIIISLVLLLFVFSSVHIIVTQSQEIEIEAKKIEYTLPYHGILPDHPLYFLKALRDRFLVFFTRDNTKKAELYLLFSDKRAGMAISLSDKGKWALATDTVHEGERFFLKIPDTLKRSKKQGSQAPEDFILKLKLSNEKHQEIVEGLIKNAPQGEQQRLDEVLRLTKRITKEITSL